MNSWKKPLIIRNIALMLGNQDLIKAYDIVDEIPDGRVKRQAQKYLSAKKFLSPRFFSGKAYLALINQGELTLLDQGL